MFLLLAAPYVGMSGGFVYSKRTLELDDTFKHKNFEHSENEYERRIFKYSDIKNENSQGQGLLRLHAGYLKSFQKMFVGMEVFLGKTLGQNYFKQNFNGGVKALVGMNLTSKFRMYGGVGIDFAQIKSLKILNGKKEHELFKWGKEDVSLDYKTHPQFLMNVGGYFLISKNISLKMDVEYLMGGAQSFDKTKIDVYYLEYFDKDSSEKYRSLRGMLGLSYHFGGKGL